MGSTPQRKIVLFLVLVTAFATPCYLRIIGAGTLGVDGGLWVLALMWAPGTAAIVTRLVTQRDLRGMGWGVGKARFLAYGYLLPVVACLLVYPAVWLTGLGGFTGDRVLATAERVGVVTGALPLAILAIASIAMIQSMISATGEEIGWRGLLVPELARVTTPTRTALISGGIWAVYHFPLILLADYGSGGPVWYAIGAFTLMVLAISFLLAWMRLSSGSFWSAAVFHASHNLWVQAIFDRLTTDSGPTEYLTTEFGIGLAVAYGVVVALIWRRGMAAHAPRAEADTIASQSTLAASAPIVGTSGMR